MPKVVSYKEGGGGGYFKAPAGGHPAIIVGVMELGTESRDFQNDGKFKDFTDIRILFEIEAEQEIYDAEKEELTGKFEDRVGIIGVNYTDFVSDKSKLGKLITAVHDVKTVKDVKNFSLDQLLGKLCFINVEMKGKDGNYETITSIAGASKKMPIHEQVRENFYFGMEDINDFSEELMVDKEVLKPWDIERIAKSQEYKDLCASLGIEVPETLDEQDENIQKEIAEKKADQEKANSEDTVSEDDAKEVFSGKDDGGKSEEPLSDEPKTTTIARDNAKKAEAEKEIEDVIDTTDAIVEEKKEEVTAEPKKKTAFE